LSGPSPAGTAVGSAASVVLGVVVAGDSVTLGAVVVGTGDGVTLGAVVVGEAVGVDGAATMARGVVAHAEAGVLKFEHDCRAQL
jgi:hypothetical protein